MLFNRDPLVYGGVIDQPSQELVKNSLGLWNCSVEDALKYGGDLTRAAIGAMNLRGDRASTVVDTKVHMLKPGMCPAIPGWHTDGVPRGGLMSPLSGEPYIAWQEIPGVRPPRFHLLVTGEGCLTEFLTSPLELEVPAVPSPFLYTKMTEDVERLKNEGRLSCNIARAPSCQVVEFDWWTIHQGVPAAKSEWRFLIRVVETDYLAPQEDLLEIIRTQQNVYLSGNYGW